MFFCFFFLLVPYYGSDCTAEEQKSRVVNVVCGSSIWGSSETLVEVHVYCMNTQQLSLFKVSQMSQDQKKNAVQALLCIFIHLEH